MNKSNSFQQGTPYLPKEAKHPLGTSTLRYIWSNKVINTAIGAKNENEARMWFQGRDELHRQFQVVNDKIEAFIKEQQEMVFSGLKDIATREHMERMAQFQQYNAFGLPPQAPPPATPILPMKRFKKGEEDIDELA